MDLSSRIYVAGHRGLVGSALVRRLQAEGYSNIITRTHAELDLEHQVDVEAFFTEERPEYVFLAAAKVGGIHANNTYPADFILKNLKIQTNVIEAAWHHEVEGLLFLGSSCIYPKHAPQPLKEEYLLTGPLEPTNEPYAIAKIAGIKLCEALNRQYGTRFISVMPTNLYGPNDNYDLENSHVLPALIRKFHLAKLASQGDWQGIQQDEILYGQVPPDVLDNLAAISRAAGHALPFSFDCRTTTARHPAIDSANPPLILWGSGTPRREFLYSDDLADACLLLMRESPSMPAALATSAGHQHLINIGYGEDLTIRDLARTVKNIVGYDGPLEWDVNKPDGTPKKLLDISKMESKGWQPKTTLLAGIQMSYQVYLDKHE